MKRNQVIRVALVTAALLAPFVGAAQSNPITNRLSFSARFGMNISAKFSGTASIAVPTPTRTTPNGDNYNYDNGYILPDISGSGDGYTWYVGYDDSASQVNAQDNTILLSRSSGLATLRSPGMDDGPSLGAELNYARELGRTEHFRYGFEAAANYLNIGMHASGSHSLRGSITNDAYAYFEGTTPPGATPADPYQGTSEGPNFVVGTTPVSSTTSQGTVGTVTGSRSLDADLWGGRLGPYLEYDLNSAISVSLSGGLAVGWVDTSVAWNETVAFTSGGTLPADIGSGSDQELLWGFYVAANVNWRLSERWSAVGSLQYQNLGTYEHTFGTRKAELDLSKSLFITVGVSYNF
jgi:opacity protein-like surface antigen